MKKMLSILSVAALFFSFAPLPPQAGPAENTSAIRIQTIRQQQNIARSLGTYVGTLPCADCKGIRIELTLQANRAGQGKTFVLRQTYLGKPAGKNLFESRGKWFAAQGNRQNPKAFIFQLIPDDDHDLLYFARLSDNAIKLLDNRQNEIASTANYTLQKQRR